MLRRALSVAFVLLTLLAACRKQPSVIATTCTKVTDCTYSYETRADCCQAGHCSPPVPVHVDEAAAIAAYCRDAYCPKPTRHCLTAASPRGYLTCNAGVCTEVVPPPKPL